MGELRKYLAIAKIVDPTSVDTQAATMGLPTHEGAIFVNIPELGLEGDNLVYCRYGLSLPYLRVKVDDKLWVEPTVGETGRWIFTSFADCAGRVEPSSEGFVIKDDEYEIIIDKVAKTLTVEMTGDGTINLKVGNSGIINMTAGSSGTININPGSGGFLNLGASPTQLCNNLPACLFSGAPHSSSVDTKV